MLINQAIVINLAARTERLARVQAAWDALGSFGVPLQRFDAVNGWALSSIPPKWSYYGPGAYGCYQSHMRALAGATGNTLVIEDDAIFDATFGDRLRALPEPTLWHQLFLGGEHTSPSPDGPTSIYGVSTIRRTHCYVVRDPKAMAEHLRSQQDLGRQVDHAMYRPDWRRFVMIPHTAGQGGGTVSDIEVGKPRTLDTWWDKRDRAVS